MPDLDVLIEIADYYNVELRELLDGERKSEQMDQELKETVLKVADYSNEEKAKFTKRTHVLFIVGCVSFIFIWLRCLMNLWKLQSYSILCREYRLASRLVW